MKKVAIFLVTIIFFNLHAMHLSQLQEAMKAGDIIIQAKPQILRSSHTSYKLVPDEADSDGEYTCEEETEEESEEEKVFRPIEEKYQVVGLRILNKKVFEALTIAHAFRNTSNWFTFLTQKGVPLKLTIQATSSTSTPSEPLSFAAAFKKQSMSTEVSPLTVMAALLARLSPQRIFLEQAGSHMYALLSETSPRFSNPFHLYNCLKTPEETDEAAVYKRTILTKVITCERIWDTTICKTCKSIYFECPHSRPTEDMPSHKEFLGKKEWISPWIGKPKDKIDEALNKVVEELKEERC